jgi:hypothetical protein
MIGRGDAVSTADYDQDGFIDFILTNGPKYDPLNTGPTQLFRNLGNSNHWLQLDLEGVISNRDGIGTKIIATTQGIQQFRLQDDGMHRSSQDHKRIHFGLGPHTIVNNLKIEWPSGIIQTINNLPADQIVQVIEPSNPSLFGRPLFSDNENSGLYIWKTSFDGPYYLITKGKGVATKFKVQLFTDKDITNVINYDIEDDDTLQWSGNYLELNSKVSTATDRLEFRLTPGSNTYIAVSQDNIPNPRQLHLGSSKAPISPVGWIINNLNELPEVSINQNYSNLGLSIGRSGNELITQWGGDGKLHTTDLSMIFSETLQSVRKVKFEEHDTLNTQDHSLKASGYVSTDWDGLNVELLPDSHIAISYLQDNLIKTNRINENSRDLGLPNAYYLPQADPYGIPDYNPESDKNLFIWKDINTDTWNVRGTAGGSPARYVGIFYSDLGYTNITPIALESTDIVAKFNKYVVYFSLYMENSWEDGFSFSLPSGAALKLLALSKTETTPILNDAHSLLMIGSERWPVSTVPLDLSGW